MGKALRSSNTRVCFCATGRTGLGHLRRITNVAAALRVLAPDAEMELVSNASVAGLSPAESGLFSTIAVMPRDAMATHLADWSDGVVVVDTAVVPRLELLPLPLVLILRETVDERLPVFKLARGRLWDAALIPAPAGEWQTDPGLIGARCVQNTGWIYRTPPVGASPPIVPSAGGEKTVVVASGGGGAGGAGTAELEAVLNLVKARTPRRLRVVQVLGPRASEDAALRSADEIVDAGSRLNEFFGAADLVISSVGYNSLLELAITDTPVLLCPVGRTYDDQRARASRWADRLGLVHEPGQTERSAAWMVSILSSDRRRDRVAIPPSGSADLAARILAVATSAPRVCTGALHAKRISRFLEETPAVVRAARGLFCAGVDTPVLRVDGQGKRLLAPHLEGPTLRECLIAHGRPAGGVSFEAWLPLLRAAFDPLVHLHGLDPVTIDARPYQPWLRIAPRLAAQSRLAARLDPRLLAIMRTLSDRMMALHAQPLRRASQAVGLVHGDLHGGQLIQDAHRENFSLVDLDDLALGEAEADIGNFIAHCLSSPDLHTGDITAGYAALEATAAAAYTAAGGRPLSRARLQEYAAIALLRRAAKLAENGIEGHFLTAILLACARLVDGARRGLRAFASESERSAAARESGAGSAVLRARTSATRGDKLGIQS